jgi:hypothetical protein
MKFLFMLVATVMADRAFPASARRFGGRFFETTPAEFYKKYGWVAFPRTIFAVCICVAAGLDFVFPINVNTQALLTIFFVVLYSISASIDVFKARK